ncbi:hypothetical protein T4E_2372 [Trichinella pseudospiralis]|uniref:Uncharacterized protein n=1 Tax=Trichinella pseudospiralis TaxID=6337 RepID=A0A0V0YPF9_TRIPS|nr:hypothetical protein T4E_2372 [Trichinella pseudospiralis]
MEVSQSREKEVEHFHPRPRPTGNYPPCLAGGALFKLNVYYVFSFMASLGRSFSQLSELLDTA